MTTMTDIAVVDVPETTVPPANQANLLQDAIVRQSRKGWRVASQSPTQATLVKGKPTNHILHLILSIITLGLWIPVWILVVVLGGEKHEVITVQPDGQVLFAGR
jgi:hypothetical protein